MGRMRCFKRFKMNQEVDSGGSLDLIRNRGSEVCDCALARGKFKRY